MVRNSILKYIILSYELKGYSTPKWKYFINHLPPCRSKPVKALFVFRTQIKIFLMHSDPPIDSNVINTINVQKCSKEIGKIIHVTSGFNRNFTKLWEYVLYAKYTKTMTLFNNSSPPHHPIAILESIHWMQAYGVLCQLRLTWRSVKLRLCHMDYFTDLLATLLHADRVNYIAVYGRVRELSECIKNILICVSQTN